MLREYETTFIIDAHLPVAEIDEIIEKVTKHIENNGGKVKLVDRWGKRRLAYEIAKKQYGYYVYIRFAAEGSFIKKLEREFKLNDSVLRFLTVLVPKVVLKQEKQLESKNQAVKTVEMDDFQGSPEAIEEDSAFSSSQSVGEDEMEQEEK